VVGEARIVLGGGRLLRRALGHIARSAGRPVIGAQPRDQARLRRRARERERRRHLGANSEAPYLSKTLRSQGAFLPNYYATGHESLDNYISMISGQAPNLITQADCPVYLDVLLGWRCRR